MKYAVLAGLAFMAFATGALAADEKWLVVGGDGSALGYDVASVKKDAAGLASLRYAVFSAQPLPPLPAFPGSALFGFLGEMTINCKDKTFRTGATNIYTAYGT